MSNFKPNSLKKLNKKSSYDDLSSFLDDELESEDDEDKLIKKNKENLKIKSISSEDLAAKKARIIEGTNFDNSLRKSKKSKKSKKSNKVKKV